MDLSYYLSISKVCIFPSIWEAFGYVALEAMSAGVPVIVSKGSGLEEIVMNGKYGYLINPLDSNNIFNQVSKILNDRNGCNEFSKQGRIRIKNYSLDSELSNQFLNLYQSII